MGIVFVQNVTMLEAWPPILRWLENAVGTTSYYVTFSIAFLVSMLIPISLLALTSWVAGKFNRESLLTNFTRFGYALIVLDMAGHMAHNLFHLLAEGKAIIFTGLALIGQGVGHDLSTALMDPGAIQMLQFGLVGLGFLGSLYTAYRIAKANYAPENVWGTFIPYAVLMVVLGAINVYLFVLPMAMRM
jgi:ethanolamine transporter EutH